MLVCLCLQIVECNALPTLILMLRSEDAAIHYEAVSSPIHVLEEEILEIFNISAEFLLEAITNYSHFPLPGDTCD